jgi:hypothetical protein
VQQRLHDEFIDTTWPACPEHPSHPLWFDGENWYCEQSGTVVAPLGNCGDRHEGVGVLDAFRGVHSRGECGNCPVRSRPRLWRARARARGTCSPFPRYVSWRRTPGRCVSRARTSARQPHHTARRCSTSRQCRTGWSPGTRISRCP